MIMFRRLILLAAIFVLLAGAVPAALTGSDCDSRESHYARAVQLHDMGDFDRALRHYQCALAQDPDSAIIPVLIDNLHRDIAGAAMAWSALPHVETDADCDSALDHARLGAEAHERAAFDLAEIHLQCALLADPRHTGALGLMGQIHINRGDTHAARHYFDRSHAVQSGGAAADTGDAMERRGPATFVMPAWLKPYEMAPSRRMDAQPRAVIALAQYLRAGGETIRLVSDKGGMTAAPPMPAPAAPSATDATFARAMQYYQARKLYAAGNTLMQALAIDPAHLEARCQLARVFTEWGNYGSALAHFERILEAEPGNACAREGRRSALLDMLAMYVPLTVDDFFFQARTYADLEEWGRARAALTRVVNWE